MSSMWRIGVGSPVMVGVQRSRNARRTSAIGIAHCGAWVCLNLVSMRCFNAGWRGIAFTECGNTCTALRTADTSLRTRPTAEPSSIPKAALAVPDLRRPVHSPGFVPLLHAPTVEPEDPFFRTVRTCLTQYLRHDVRALAGLESFASFRS